MMKKLMLVIIMIFSIVSVSHAVKIDISNSTTVITGDTTMTLNHVLAMKSFYWMDLAWDSKKNVFKVKGYGKEDEPLEMVRISSGEFTMGSPDYEMCRDGDETQHQVILSKSFYIGSYEVKQQEWIYLMGNNPSYFKGNNLPVEGVSWFDAIDFCNALSDYMSYERAYTVNGQTVTWNQGANGYRLPTESEWEYACRAGSKGAYYNGLNSSCGNDPNLDPIAWYCYNSSSKTHEVGQKDPNTWGLYDMSGNVWEWNWDWYGTYPPGPVTDPTGPTSGSCRVPRGGSWGDYAQYCRSAFRVNHYPSSRSNVLGFRIARNAN